MIESQLCSGTRIASMIKRLVVIQMRGGITPELYTGFTLWSLNWFSALVIGLYCCPQTWLSFMCKAQCWCCIGTSEDVNAVRNSNIALTRQLSLSQDLYSDVVYIPIQYFVYLKIPRGTDLVGGNGATTHQLTYGRSGVCNGASWIQLLRVWKQGGSIPKCSCRVRFMIFLRNVWISHNSFIVLALSTDYVLIIHLLLTKYFDVPI